MIRFSHLLCLTILALAIVACIAEKSIDKGKETDEKSIKKDDKSIEKEKGKEEKSIEKDKEKEEKSMKKDKEKEKKSVEKDKEKEEKSMKKDKEKEEKSAEKDKGKEEKSIKKDKEKEEKTIKKDKEKEEKSIKKDKEKEEKSIKKEKEKDEKDKGKGDKKTPEIAIYELKAEKMQAKFTNWGASLMSFYLPDKNGKMADVVLGYDKPDDYKNDTVYFGATVGRVANRIGGAKFSLDGKEYKLIANDGKNTLHGGKPGYSDVVWNVQKYKKDGNKPSITFTYESEDGEQGFPGNLKVQVTYELDGKENSMKIKMDAKPSKKATPVNLAHHSYWNLGGHNSGDILSHSIQIAGSQITPTDDELIPTGELKPVKGTPYDFLSLKSIGTSLKQLPKGYDINYCLDVDQNNKDNNKLSNKLNVILEDPKSGRKMELSSNQVGLQFYTGGMLKDVKGKEGAVYKAHAGLALETQGYPDSVNHHNFPCQIVKPGETYKHDMVFKFSISGK